MVVHRGAAVKTTLFHIPRGTHGVSNSLVPHVSNEMDRRIAGAPVRSQTDLLSLDGAAVIPPRDARYQPKAGALEWRMEHLWKTA